MSTKILDAVVDAIKEKPLDPNKKLAKRLGLKLTLEQSAKLNEFDRILTHIDDYQTSLGFGTRNGVSKRLNDARQAHIEALLRGETPEFVWPEQVMMPVWQASNINASEARRQKWAEMKAYFAPVIESFAAVAQKEIDKLEAKERAVHDDFREDFEVSHQRSSIVQRLHDFVVYIRRCGTAHKAKDLFPYLDL